MIVVLILALSILVYGAVYIILTKNNYSHNIKIDSNPKTSTRNQMINGQRIGIYSGFAYGVRSDGGNTCAAVAIHNVRVYLRMESTLSQAIYDVQKCGGMRLLGALGTYPGRVDTVLDYCGIRYTAIKGTYDMTEKGMYIISYYVRGKITNGIHTIAVEYDGTSYIAYNRYSNREYAMRINIEDFSDWLICGFYVGKTKRINDFSGQR